MAQNELLLALTDQAHPVAALLGHVMASLFLLWVISLAWEGVLFKRITDDPVVGKLCSVAAAWATALVMRVVADVEVPGLFEDFDLIALVILSGIAFWAGVRLREKIRLEDEQA